MTRYQCTACDAVERIEAFTSDACSSCGGRLVDLDAAEKHAEDMRRIAQANDAFRQTGGNCAPILGRWVVTRGVQAEGADFVREAVGKVMAVTEFTEDWDPYGEHGMGAVEVQGKTVWWKIDLFDRSYEYGSSEPADPEQTRRVLTLLLPEEY